MTWEFNHTKITELRQSKNLSMEEFGAPIGKTRQNVSMWEAGVSKPNVDSICSMCNAYRVNPNFFFSRLATTVVSTDRAA